MRYRKYLKGPHWCIGSATTDVPSCSGAEASMQRTNTVMVKQTKNQCYRSQAESGKASNSEVFAIVQGVDGNVH